VPPNTTCVLSPVSSDRFSDSTSFGSRLAMLTFQKSICTSVKRDLLAASVKRDLQVAVRYAHLFLRRGLAREDGFAHDHLRFFFICLFFHFFHYFLTEGGLVREDGFAHDYLRYARVKRDLLQRQKRPTKEQKKPTLPLKSSTSAGTVCSGSFLFRQTLIRSPGKRKTLAFGSHAPLRKTRTRTGGGLDKHSEKSVFYFPLGSQGRAWAAAWMDIRKGGEK
jgi:hypothetical protein